MSKNAIVIYSSKYGSTKKYAEWIANALDAPLADAKTVKPETLDSYDIVVLGGGLYAGGIAGAKLLTGRSCKNCIVFTVGLADPVETDYSETVQKNFTPVQLSEIQFFHLRGGIDYSKLNLPHKIMMSMMQRMILKRPENERTKEDNEFVKLYGKQIDFTDRESIQPLVTYVRGIMPF